MELNYKKLGLKCGIEIHQQLDTKKLFCNCPSLLRDDASDIEIKRDLRAVAGETGEIDIAAAHEMKKEKHFLYEAYNDTTCLVEADCEPPHDVNKEAVEIALQTALLVNAKPVDLVQFMRKTVVDGSNTSGFQRTALIARNGFIETSKGPVRIPTICLEEEAAKIIEAKTNFVRYRLDRLGIPLIEIGTAADIISPEQCKEVAEKLGMFLRSTGRVKRGIGTIRQDVNVSIKDGARVEIKGAQELKMLPKLVEYEVLRQASLLEIKKELEKRKIAKGSKSKDVQSRVYDLTTIFKNTSSKVIKGNLSKNDSAVLGIRLEDFAALIGREIQPNRRLGTEFSDYAKVIVGIQGLFHSDELPNYGIDENEINQIKNLMKTEKNDAFIIISDEKTIAERALNTVIERASIALVGIPNEVRKANQDATTSYLRPMPGSARMYPETDIPTIKPDTIKIKLPELITEKSERYQETGLSRELANAMSKSKYRDFFEILAEKYQKVPAAVIADALINKMKELKTRLKLNPDKITEEQLHEIFSALNNSRISKDAVFEVIVEIAKGKSVNVIKEYSALSDVELEETLKKLVAENKNMPFNALVGRAMSLLRGKADGKKIVEILKKVTA